MKKLCIVCLIFMASCMSRELIKTSSTNTSIVGTGFIFENDTVRVSYYFWGEDGMMKFTIKNKLNIPIFIDWKTSSFIYNSNNYQYWHDIDNSTSINHGMAIYNTNLLVHQSVTNTSIEHPDRIESISPGSFTTRNEYSLLTSKSSIRPGGYTLDNSPIIFRNYLVLCGDESFNKKFYIDNTFYVLSAEIIKEKDFEKPVYAKDGSRYMNSPYKDPTRFYSESYKYQ